MSDALLEGHSRFIAGTPANLQPSETVDATIVRHAATESPQRHARATPAPRPRRARATLRSLQAAIAARVTCISPLQVLLTPLSSGMSAHALLDTPKQNLFVVECSTPKLDAIAVGNIEHAAMVLGCRCVRPWCIGLQGLVDRVAA